MTVYSKEQIAFPVATDNVVLENVTFTSLTDREKSTSAYHRIDVGVREGEDRTTWIGSWDQRTQRIDAGTELRTLDDGRVGMRLRRGWSVVARVFQEGMPRTIDGSALTLTLGLSGGRAGPGKPLLSTASRGGVASLERQINTVGLANRTVVVALRDATESATMTAILASDVSTAADTVAVDVTGLAFPFLTGQKYIVEVFGTTQAPANTTGYGLQLNTSVAVTLVTMTFFHQLANTGTLTGGSSIADDASVGVSSGVPAADTIVPFYACGVLVPSTAAGTAQLRFRSEVAAVSTIKANTILRVRAA